MNTRLYIFISNNQKQSKNNVSHVVHEVFVKQFCKILGSLEWIPIHFFFFVGLSFPGLYVSNTTVFWGILKLIPLHFFLIEMVMNVYSSLLFLFINEECIVVAMLPQSQILLAHSVSPITLLWETMCWRGLYIWLWTHNFST